MVQVFQMARRYGERGYIYNVKVSLILIDGYDWCMWVHTSSGSYRHVSTALGTCGPKCNILKAM